MAGISHEFNIPTVMIIADICVDLNAIVGVLLLFDNVADRHCHE